MVHEDNHTACERGSFNISPTGVGISTAVIALMFLAVSKVVQKGQNASVQMSREIPQLKVRLEIEFDIDIVNCEIIDVVCGPSTVVDNYPEAVDPSSPVPIPGKVWGMAEGGKASAHRLVRCFIEQELSVILEVTYLIKVKSCKVINVPKSFVECCIPVPRQQLRDTTDSLYI